MRKAHEDVAPDAVGEGAGGDADRRPSEEFPFAAAVERVGPDLNARGDAVDELDAALHRRVDGNVVGLFAGDRVVHEHVVMDVRRRSRLEDPVAGVGIDDGVVANLTRHAAQHPEAVPQNVVLDHQIGRGNADLHHVHEALAAGDHPRVVARGEKPHRLVHR